MSFRKYTEEQFIDAVANSRSIASLLSKLYLAPKGGNYRTMHRYIQKLGLDTSHMTGQGWSKNTVIDRKRPLDDYLSNKYPIQSHSLKNRLLNEGRRDRICNKCHNTTWLDQPVPLELHHVDGNHNNNLDENLELLCPNCHALTKTYRGRNKKISYGRRKLLHSTNGYVYCK